MGTTMNESKNGAGSARMLPDPQVPGKPQRTRYTTEYKLRILEELDQYPFRGSGGIGKEGRPDGSRERSGNGANQPVPEASTLEAERLDGGKAALQESAASSALNAITGIAPLNGMANHALGVVIGWLYALDAAKAIHGRFVLKKIEASGHRPWMVASGAKLQIVANLSA